MSNAPGEERYVTCGPGECESASLRARLRAVEGERDSAYENLAHVLDLQEYIKEQLEMERRLLAHANQTIVRLSAGGPDVIAVEGHDAKYWWDRAQEYERLHVEANRVRSALAIKLERATQEMAELRAQTYRENTGAA